MFIHYGNKANLLKAIIIHKQFPFGFYSAKIQQKKPNLQILFHIQTEKLLLVCISEIL